MGWRDDLDSIEISNFDVSGSRPTRNIVIDGSIGARHEGTAEDDGRCRKTTSITSKLRSGYRWVEFIMKRIEHTAFAIVCGADRDKVTVIGGTVFIDGKSIYSTSYIARCARTVIGTTKEYITGSYRRGGGHEGVGGAR